MLFRHLKRRTGIHRKRVSHTTAVATQQPHSLSVVITHSIYDINLDTAH